MNRARIVGLPACLVIWLAAVFASTGTAAARQETSQDKLTAVVFLDVAELPARIDEPKLDQTDSGFTLKCAIANRSSEKLLGLRLIMLVVEPSGKLRSRITWTDAAELASFSIRPITLHPAITGDLRKTDQLFLVIDEVIGHETIWRVVGAEKALRDYSRGRHDDLPTVRAVANQYDPPFSTTRIIH